MHTSTFTIDQIHVGDEVLFRDEHPVEHNLFWRVVNKLSNNSLIVEIKEMGYADKFIVSVKDIIDLKRSSFAY